MIWNEQIECMPRAELEKLQLERLKDVVSRVYENVPYYRAKMEKANVTPADIKSLSDIIKLPFTDKKDLRDTYPFGMFAVPQSQVVRVHASSGTTGKPVVVGYTKNDIKMWEECVARCYTMAGLGENDVIQIAYGYGLFTGGLGAHYGAEKIGAMTVPMSTGNTQKLIDMMLDFGATCVCCTPSYLLHIAEVLEQEGLIDKIKLRASINGAEPWTENMRKMIEEKLHIHAHDIYGLSEMMGPGVACDCKYHNGLHICEDHFFAEIVNPETGEPVSSGETGELVFTTLTKEGIPLIRYRTHDLTSICYDKCECGRTSARISRFKGRCDDMLVIRGVNVFPSQIETALLSVPEVEPQYLIVVDRVNNSDTLEVSVELNKSVNFDEIKSLERITKSVQQSIQQIIGLSVKVKLVEPNSLERSMGKSKHVIDKRNLV